ncbi:hypothetical protein MPTK1_1g18690 [Marchantia polymorpha subsp. ruderalis]|uniref:Uncharacterized protein n=2 Tax=Marchantia polymorpha TaxID=3197 RepID=A0AAF6ARM9_MARPO|nr:hypothetical protein MARPO_0001s0207 [Marchantia polymorpha]BBM99099.1 hypothetical protein Mp_1g18690 [Marchantia polymorpha subsp. ruderalis]|eukprot:PTQ50176.1 hypothetical protein MARPO_0001s0207 [Marchantia polymorpha]
MVKVLPVSLAPEQSPLEASFRHHNRKPTPMTARFVGCDYCQIICPRHGPYRHNLRLLPGIGFRVSPALSQEPMSHKIPRKIRSVLSKCLLR